MRREQLWAKYPRMYHMAEPGSWPSISERGLLSTSALLDLFAKSDKERVAIEARRRPEKVILEDPIHGRAVIRDQKPLSEERLASCLCDGMTVEKWLRLLNGRVFFWLEESRLEVLRRAKEYSEKRQLVLTIDTQRLVKACSQCILLTHMNTGATRPFAYKRGRETFRTISDYPFDAHRRVVELTVADGIMHIEKYVLKVEELGGDEPPLILFGS